MSLRCLAASLCALLPLGASAVPIEIELIGDTAAATATLSLGCTTRGGCGSPVIGTLFADMHGSLLTGVRGDVRIDGMGSVSVLDGAFDLTGRTSSFFVTNLFGTFTFSQVSWSGGNFSFWGGNWSDGCTSYLGCKLVWLRLRGRIEEPGTEIPEPNSAPLFGAGAFLVSRRVARRR